MIQIKGSDRKIPLVTAASIAGYALYGVELADGLEWINVDSIEKFKLEPLGMEEEDDDGVGQKLFGVERL